MNKLIVTLLIVLMASSALADTVLQLNSECYDPVRDKGIMRACTKDGSSIVAQWEALGKGVKGEVALEPCDWADTTRWSYFLVPPKDGGTDPGTIMLTYGLHSTAKTQAAGICMKDYFPDQNAIPEFTGIGIGIVLIGSGLILHSKRKNR